MTNSATVIEVVLKHTSKLFLSLYFIYKYSPSLKCDDQVGCEIYITVLWEISEPGHYGETVMSNYTNGFMTIEESDKPTKAGLLEFVIGS